MVFRKMRFRGYDTTSRFSRSLVRTSPNLFRWTQQKIAVNGIKIRFWTYSSASEIFAAELQSRPKSGQILHVFGSWIFFGVRLLKFWTVIIKQGLLLIIVQNFTLVDPRMSEISRSEKNLTKNWGEAKRESARRFEPDWRKFRKVKFPR